MSTGPDDKAPAVRDHSGHAGPGLQDPAAMDQRAISTLLFIMAALRHPDTGCPWDQVQTFASIAPYTIEEAYEVADAIQSGSRAALCDELGDLLLQVVYHARMAEEEQTFDFGDVVRAINAKMIRRHPHVFGTPDERSRPPQKGFWEKLKASEVTPGAPETGNTSILDGVPLALPALVRAIKLQAKASRVGFDWPDAGPVYDKVAEEIAEIKQAVADGGQKAIHHEIGDLLFAVTNLARHLEVDAETALSDSSRRFQSRFAHMETALKALDRQPQEVSQDYLEALWNKAKLAERTQD